MIKSKSKVILTLIFIMIISIVASLSAMTGIAFADSDSSDFKTGHGTAESPYEITSVEEFNNVRYHLGAHFKQKDNLDLSGSEFSPIGSVTFPFTGYYDGGQYQISNVHIKQNSNNVGLFAFVDNGGVVENLKIVNAEIKGEYNVGSIAGTNRGLVIGCVSAADVLGNGAVGGIVGLNAVGGKVKECGNTGNVYSNKTEGMYVGGIVGVNNSLVQNCYNHGRINSEDNTSITYSGGIVGLNDGESYKAEIDHCYNIGNIFGNARGQVAGDNIKGKINDCKWQASELNKVASFDSGIISNAVVLDRKGFGSASSFNGWDFNGIWKYIKSKSEYPLLNREYVEVESVSFEESKIALRQGDSLELKAVVKPIHATENKAKLKLNSNIPGVILNSNNVLSVAKTIKHDTVINITATAENKSAKLTVTVAKIQVDSIKLINLDGKNEISSLHGLHFKGEISPNDATYKGVKYEVDSSFAEITADGFLTIKENAPIGTKITVSAVSVDNPIKSHSLTVTVVKEPVTSVEINSQNSFKVTGSLRLSAKVLPVQASVKDITYKIVSSTADGASLIDNVLTARGLGTITVVAEADGVKSEEFTVQVLKEPVTGIIWNTKDRVTCGDILVLNATAIPANATFGEIQYKIVGDNTAHATIVDGVLHATTAGTVTVRAIADDFVSDKEIIIDKVPVESIELNFADSFKHTESLVLDVNIAPENATYKNDIIYEILDDSADSRIESGILYAEKPGTVTVKVTADGISAEKAISVLKESVQSVSLNAVYQESNNGETYQFVASVYPANATNQDVIYILKSGKATLSETGLLLIDPTIPAGSLIEVYAIVDGIESSIYEIKSGRIDVESVSLVPETETIKVGEGVRLITSTIPAVVSNPGVTYIVDGNAEVIDGVLYVFDTEAVGTIVNVTAVVDGVESQVVSINVVATPVENVTFACANSFKVTGSLKLTVTVYPQSATDKTVAYTIISGKEIGAEIIDGYLYAEKIGVVKVRATVGDISRDLVVCVQKEPVTKIVFTSPISVKVNNALKLSATAYPLNATFKDVSFELIHNDINAEIIDGNTLFSSQVGKVTVRVIADDTYEDFEIEVIKEPVTGLVFAKTTFKHTESLNLVTRVLPGNATYNEVSYTILNNYVGYKDIGARIENGRLYANEPGFIRLLITTDNGDYSETVEIEVTKEPVIGITMADFDEPLRLDYRYRVGQIDLGTIVYPLNATYQHIEYSIEEVNCIAIRNGDIITVTLLDLMTTKEGIATDEQASITVKAVADGVEFYKTYVFHKYDLADENEIIFNPNSRNFKTSGQFDFSISLPEKVTCKDIDVKITNQDSDGIEYVDAKLFNNNGLYTIKANFPGTLTVQVTSLSSGQSKDFIVDVDAENVVNSVLGLQVVVSEQDKEGETSVEATGSYSFADVKVYNQYTLLRVKQNSTLSWRGFGYATDKTLKVTYSSMSQFELRAYKDKDGRIPLSQDNDYFKLDEDTITIKLDAPAKSEFYICAVNKKSGKASSFTKLIIDSAYINDIRKTTISSDGVISGLESIETKYIEKVVVSIKHSPTGIVLTKEIKTSIPTVILQLYNRNLGGYFDVEYEVYFKQTLSDNSIHTYSYKRDFKKEGSSDNSFKGLSGTYSYREYPSKYSSIVWLDNYSNTSSSYKFENEVKAVYVYSSYNTTKTTFFEFNNDSSNTTDFYLNKYSFNSTAGNNAISVNHSGGFNLITNGDIKITAANDSNGQNVLYMPYANLTINNNGALTLIAGDGANGSNGTSYDRNESDGGSGNPPSGESGTRGGNGGIAIYANNLNLSTSNGALTIRGGNGGNGGTGGNGHGSDRGGRPKAGNGGAGGAGGSGGSAIVVSNSLVLDVSTNSINIISGNGGNGGNGGHGGHGRDAHYSDHGGDGGVGGKAGNGGNAIQTYSLNLKSTTGTISITTGNGGKGGNGGDGGDGYYNFGNADNGSGANGGNSGDSGSVIVSSFTGNKTQFNNCISLGTVCSGGSKGSNGTGNGNAASGSPRDGYAGTVGKKVS